MGDVSTGFVRLMGIPLPSEYHTLTEAGNGHIYAVPRRSGRVLDIDPTGGLVQEIGEAFEEPLGEGALYFQLAKASNGHLYAAPCRARRALEIDPYEGLVMWIGPDFGEAPLCPHYRGIAAGQDGCLYSPPCAVGHVLKIDPASGEVTEMGQLIESALTFKDQYDCITLAKNGSLFAAPNDAPWVLEINPTSGDVRRFGAPLPDQDAALFKKYDHLTLASNGKLYAAPRHASHVLEVDPVAGTVQQIGDSLQWCSGFFTPLRECADGTLWALSCGSPLATAVLIQVDPNSATVSVHKVRHFMQDPPTDEYEHHFGQCALAGNGRLYATSWASGTTTGSRILEFDPQTLVAREIGEAVLCTWTEPAVTSTGRLVILPRYANSRIVQVDYDALPRPESSSILSRLRGALDSGDLADVVVRTLHGRSYRAHKLVLALRSKVLRGMFDANMREANAAVVELGDVTPSVSDMFMTYLYAETAGADKMSLQELYELCSLAHRYEIQDLMSACSVQLLASLRVENAANLLRFADQLLLADVKQACFEFVAANPDVVDTDEWEEVPPALVQEAAAAFVGRPRKRRRASDWEFPAGTDWTKLTIPKLRRACVERGLAQEGEKANLIERLQA